MQENSKCIGVAYINFCGLCTSTIAISDYSRTDPRSYEIYGTNGKKYIAPIYNVVIELYAKEDLK